MKIWSYCRISKGFWGDFCLIIVIFCKILVEYILFDYLCEQKAR